MKTYTITEEVIDFHPAEFHGQKYYKEAKREVISTQQASTIGAWKIICMFAENISPFTLNRDEYGRIESCKIYFHLNKLQAKEISIKRNKTTK